MKKLLIHILTIVFLVVSCCVAGAQEQLYDSLDAELARYESLCQMCLELRERVKQGEDVTKNEAEVFINRFLAMNKSLKQREGEMTQAQRVRFADVAKWFSTGERPLTSYSAMLPKLDMPEYDAEALRFLMHDDVLCDAPVAVRTELNPGNLILLASMNAPDMAYGALAGYMYRKWGGYVSFRSNLVFGKTVYACQSDGSMPGGRYFWANGEERRSNMFVTAGGLYGFNSWLVGYLGAGYGWRTLAWQDVDAEWAEVRDWSVRGVAAEIGLLFSWKQFIGSIGVSTIAFKTCSLTVGLGYKFSL